MLKMSTLCFVTFLHVPRIIQKVRRKFKARKFVKRRVRKFPNPFSLTCECSLILIVCKPIIIIMIAITNFILSFLPDMRRTIKAIKFIFPTGSPYSKYFCVFQSSNKQKQAQSTQTLTFVLSLRIFVIRL